MDEPESLAGLSLATREGLDNLTFVINCNLQRLDGPVRGNGKIIQELEGLFRGAGWNVIKVIWGREWDDLLARDVDGVLVEQMNNTLDGEFQKFSVAGGAYIRENFFGPDPRLRKLVEHLTDDDLTRLRRGGHDYRKVYAAYKAAVGVHGRPDRDPRPHRQGLDPRLGRRGPQHHPPGQEALRGRAADLPRPHPAADPGRGPQGRPVLPPGPEVARGRVPPRAPGRARWPAPPKRIVRYTPLPEPRAGGRRGVRGRLRHPGLDRRWPSPGCSGTSSAIRESGARIVPIIPDEARTFGMDPLFKEVGIYASQGQRYYAGRLGPRAQLPRGDRRPGPRGGHHRGRLDGQPPGRRDLLLEPRPGR